MSYKVLSTTGSEPLTLADAKLYLRVTHSLEDTEITAMISSARAFAEEVLGYWLVDRVLEQAFSGFPGSSVLTMSFPVEDPPTSISYYDVDDVLQSFDVAKVTVDSFDPRNIILNTGESWPEAVSENIPDPVRVVYNTVTDNELIDDIVMKGLKKDLADLYIKRDDPVETGTRFSVAKVYRMVKKYNF